MAKLATPRLIDVVPSVQSLRTVIDRLTEVGTNPATPGAARITLRCESGTLGAVLMVSSNGTNWTDISVAVSDKSDSAVIARLNRLLNGFAIKSPNLQTVITSRSVAPRFETYWRTKALTAKQSGRRWELPLQMTGKPVINNQNVMVHWTITRGSVALIDNTAAGFTPLSAAGPVRARRTRRGSATVSATPAPTATATSPVTPIGSPSPTVQTTVAPTLKVSPLPTGHPGIFQMPRVGLTALHTNQVVIDDLNDAIQAFEDGEAVTVVLRGPSGTGKTLAAQTVALQNGLPFVKFDVAGMRDFGDWTGTVSLRESNGVVITDFTPSRFAEAVMIDGPYAGIPRLVILDEATRAETSGSMNALTGILDGTRTVYVPDARKSIVIDPAVIFVMTANIGAQFHGTVELDEAIANRATHWIVVDYPDTKSEVLALQEQSSSKPVQTSKPIPPRTRTQPVVVSQAAAQKLVSVADQIRAMAARGEIDSSISTRQLVQVAKAVGRGRLPIDAFRVAYIQRLSAEGGNASDVTKVTTTVEAALR